MTARRSGVKAKARRAVTKIRKQFAKGSPAPKNRCPAAPALKPGGAALLKYSDLRVGPAPQTGQIVGVIPYTKEFDGLFNAIKLGGDDAFKEKARGDLWRIYNTPTGKDLLLSIRDSGKSLSLGPLTPEDAQKYGPYTMSAGDDIYPNIFGKPGKGSDASIFYDPDQTMMGHEPWMSSLPPGIVLAHEIIHAQHMMTGTSFKGWTDNDHQANPDYEKLGSWDARKIYTPKYTQARREEVETAGIPPNDKGRFTENKIRKEWSPSQPARPHY